LPTIVRYDTQARDITGTFRRILDPGNVIYLPPASAPAGATLHGLTANAIQMVKNQEVTRDEAAGITAIAWEEPGIPVSTHTAADAVTLPMLSDPNSVFVINAA
jgi:hypothetical protein